MRLNLQEVKTLLPRQILEIAAMIGLPAATRLVEQLGGTTWAVGKGEKRLAMIRREALAEIIGEKATDLMVARYYGGNLYIPRCEAALRRLRDIEINRQFVQGTREGVSANTLVAELARSYQISDRHVWTILKLPDDGEQGITNQLF
jgi:Mor family transcriptional regulator